MTEHIALIGRRPCGCVVTGCMLNSSNEAIIMTIEEIRSGNLTPEFVNTPVQLQGNCTHVMPSMTDTDKEQAS